MEFGGPHAEINAISSVKSGDLDKLKEVIFCHFRHARLGKPLVRIVLLKLG